MARIREPAGRGAEAASPSVAAAFLRHPSSFKLGSRFLPFKQIIRMIGNGASPAEPILACLRVHPPRSFPRTPN